MSGLRVDIRRKQIDHAHRVDENKRVCDFLSSRQPS